MHKAIFATWMALTVTSASSNDLWPWASQAPTPPPTVKPYEIPTMSGNKRDFRAAPASWVKAPRIDGDAVFRTIIACYPTKTYWNLDVDLQAAIRNTDAVDISGTTIGRSMVGIVARMPIYSRTEIDREREREYKRRSDTAAKVAEFVNQLASRNQALRQLAIAASMEQRAQIRVNEGIADAAEQIQWLDKIAQLESSLISAEAKAMDARLTLVAMCRDGEADTVNAYLTELSQLSDKAKP